MSETNGITAELETAMADAADVAPTLAASLTTTRAGWLRAIADRLDADADALVELAMRESHLTKPRLTGELVRTTFQLRLFAQVAQEGRFLEATIDHADPEWPMGARPDLRRVLRPLGPAAVFAASNFPFAFSVAGGDTAAAIAAGAPVVVKAHSAHPELSRAVATHVQAALAASGAPRGVFALVEGRETGRALVSDPRLTVATFTGSLNGGRALFDLAAARPEPIPFYGELGSINPVFVTPAAAASRPEQIADGFAASMTLSVGQFCTKPGVLLVPESSPLGDLVVAAVGAIAGGPMLSDGMRDGYFASLAPLAARDDVELLAGSPDRVEQPTPTLYGTDAHTFVAHADELLEEHFGPAAVLVRYSSEDELLAVARTLRGQLTATIQGEPGDDAGELVEILADKAGRVLFNGWPTGVSVTYAQQHGGPYPATTAPHFTSVGTASIGRFLRPVAYQDTPDALLPPALQEANPWGVPRTVDGTVVPPPQANPA
ncbi:aldehyde dehydrogenase (NADP(+)) [Leifsonia sp. Root112D2]|uniref:aldehyde dehydrogenase (NADP(+)) n=1 Tax=Leifsonia sp. Root112D2 TaxID=1736426 RepID=UPI0006FD962C|nr:aldehyde dehydrogenase (NADP(+)) [Leifsonia sp. Root112D2]KQV07098.1 aldehyde dehydrogenase [Leifsonia sp. Root112D2]